MSGALENGRFVSSDGLIEVGGVSRLADGDYFMVIRPEAIKAAQGDRSGHVRIQGIVQKMKFGRGMYVLKVKSGNQLLECVCTTSEAERTAVGEPIDLLLDMKEVCFLKE